MAALAYPGRRGIQLGKVFTNDFQTCVRHCEDAMRALARHGGVSTFERAFHDPFWAYWLGYERTCPIRAASVRRTIHRLLSANSVFNCAVFLASPR